MVFLFKHSIFLSDCFIKKVSEWQCQEIDVMKLIFTSTINSAGAKVTQTDKFDK